MLKYLLTASLGLFGSTAAAQDINDSGRYFLLGNTEYMTKGAESVRAPGQFGLVTGKGFWGLFVKNGFGHLGFTTSGGELTGSEFTVSGRIILNGKGNLSPAVATNGTANVDAARAIDRAKSYKGLLVEVEDWDRVRDDLNELALRQPPGAAIFSDDLRVIGSVLYVTTYTADSKVNFGGNLAIDVNDGNAISVVGSFSGNSTIARNIRLSDGSTLAYTMRHVCWQDGQIAAIVPDEPRLPRPGDCGRYR